MLLDMYNETLKKEINNLYDSVVFMDERDVKDLPEGNVVTVHSSLKKLYEFKKQAKEFIRSLMI